MPMETPRVLFAGTPAPTTDEVLARMATRGFGACRADNLSRARSLVEAGRVDVVLANEFLSGGSGYALADAMKRSGGTLIVGVALSENCLWLPVVERGATVLGRRAFSCAMLEVELGRLLGDRMAEEKRAYPARVRLSDGRPDSDRTLRPWARRNREYRIE